MRSTDTLKSHPDLLKERLFPAEARVLTLEKLGESLFEHPLLITQEGFIVDGYVRWRIAILQKRPAVLCLEFQLSKQEALLRILQNQSSRPRLNAYLRIRLALNLETHFREQAVAHQSAGGKRKALSKLTEDRRIDCRREIARAAGCCLGNVTKVKQIHRSGATSEAIKALRSGEISIHFGWRLSKLPAADQRAELGSRAAKRRSMARMRKLLSKHEPDCFVEPLRYLQLGLTGLKAVPSPAVLWEPIDNLLSAIEHSPLNVRSPTNAESSNPQIHSGQQPGTLGQSLDKVCSP